jgi:hypothetical protein
VKQHYGEESEEGEDSGVKGYMDLITFLDKVRLRERNLVVTELRSSALLNVQYRL